MGHGVRALKTALWVVTAVSLVTPPNAFALGQNERCDSITSDAAWPDGKPHYWQSSRYYDRSGCRDGMLFDVTYRNISPLPGIYMSWGDSEPATQEDCLRAQLLVYAWDLTVPGGGRPIYLGTRSSSGQWVDNPNPIGNPGTTKVCKVPPIQVNDGFFSLPVGETVRFGVRAEYRAQSGLPMQRKQFALATAPLADRAGLNAVIVNMRSYVALFRASTSYIEGTFRGHVAAWPAGSSWRYSLGLESTPPGRVAEGGDLLFQDGLFFLPEITYFWKAHPNFGGSNAMFNFRGDTGLGDDLGSVSCPDFTITQQLPSQVPTYNYRYLMGGGGPPLTSISTATEGSHYCFLNARNDRIYNLKVFKSRAFPGDSTHANLIVVGYKFNKYTGRQAWGCLDGTCNSKIKVASMYTKYGAVDRDQFVKVQAQRLESARGCLEANLERTLSSPMHMELHAEHLEPRQAGGRQNGSTSGGLMSSVGFIGQILAGDRRIEQSSNLRYELHEVIHYYNYHFFKVMALPSWLEEGFAVQAATRLTCKGDPNYMRDGWRDWHPGDPVGGWEGGGVGYEVGSEFFRRLESNYGCDVSCAAKFWGSLSEAHEKDTHISNAEIKAVAESRIGQDLTWLFNLLGIAY